MWQLGFLKDENRTNGMAGLGHGFKLIVKTVEL